jgi:hypothetical protein
MIEHNMPKHSSLLQVKSATVFTCMLLIPLRSNEEAYFYSGAERLAAWLPSLSLSFTTPPPPSQFDLLFQYSTGESAQRKVFSLASVNLCFNTSL